MNFKKIILAYFVIGAVMFGGGVIAMDDTGLAQWFIDTDGDQVSVEERVSNNDDDTKSKFEELGNSIKSVVNAFGGPLILVWNTVTGLIGYMHWPVVVLASNNAPPKITILVGGSFVAAFYVSIVGLVMSS